MAMIAGGTGMAAAVVVAQGWKHAIWPFELFACVDAAAFIAGLVIFGVRGAH